MRLQILHHAHEHEHEHARTVSLHPLFIPLTHASRGYAGTRGNRTPRRRARTPAPPRRVIFQTTGCHTDTTRCSPRSRLSLTRRTTRTRERVDARALLVDRSRRDARAYRIDALASVSTHRRSSSSVVAVAAFGRSTRGVFVRVSRARDVEALARSRRGSRCEGCLSTAVEASSESNAHVRRALTTREVERTSGNGDDDEDADAYARSVVGVSFFRES